MCVRRISVGLVADHHPETGYAVLGGEPAQGDRQLGGPVPGRNQHVEQPVGAEILRRAEDEGAVHDAWVRVLSDGSGSRSTGCADGSWLCDRIRSMIAEVDRSGTYPRVRTWPPSRRTSGASGTSSGG